MQYSLDCIHVGGMAEPQNNTIRLVVSLYGAVHASLNALGSRGDDSLPWVIRQAIQRFVNACRAQLKLQLTPSE